MSDILKTERLTKTYGKCIAVNQVSVTVRRGDIYGLIPNIPFGKLPGQKN